MFHKISNYSLQYKNLLYHLIRSMPMVGDFPKRSIVVIGNKVY
ncbi:hypothetical protein HMPREF1551_02388 [Capnocytophaga sp. oral taxon 863 str. F0517]|nr:hypothetical protein HMPREF1551_02388 [Capnocytophaga sp. oral taxon 863 str. F0517]